MKTLAITALLMLVGATASHADPTADRAKKTADGVIDLSVRLMAAMDGADCKVVLASVNKFATSTATERAALETELGAAKKDKAYGDALKLELKKDESKLRGLKRPQCMSDQGVKAAARKALPAGA